MDDDLGKVLPHWPAIANPDDVQPVATTQSFSGAQIWRVTVGNRSYALRKWPEMRFDWRRTESHKERFDWRIAEIHAIQNHLASNAPDVVPALVRSAEGKTAVIIGKKPNPRRGHCWEVSHWMPGESISIDQVTPQRAASAMRALARVHLGALQPASQEQRSECPWVWKQRDQYAKRHSHPLRSLSDAMFTRLREITKIVESPLHEFWPSDRVISERPEFHAALELVNRAAKRFHPVIAPWANVELPLHPRHGDAHLGNFLFTGDKASALIDYGAADLDCHAADVGRLLGTAVGDDAARRTAALDAYESVRPLSDLERAAVDVFDRGGVIVAASRWIFHLQPDPPEIPDLTAPPRPFDLAGFQRLRVLLERVRVIAGEAPAGGGAIAGTFA